MRPDVSIVINTCAGSKNPRVLAQKGSFGNPGKHPYAVRAAKLERALERYKSEPVEVIVVGEWHEGEGYTYVESPGVHNDPTDQIPQRHTGAQAAQGDIVVFLNDDHFLDGAALLVEEMRDTDVGAFKRFAKMPTEEVTLPTGWASYVHGHGCAMTREALRKMPWSAVTTLIQCDVIHTQLCRDAELKIKQLERPFLWDIEVGDLP